MMRWFIIFGMIAMAVAAWVRWSVVERPLVVMVAPVVEHVPVTVFGLGSVEARILSRVGFEIPGTLVDVLVDHGDHVSAGKPLARLNAATQEARVARAEAAVRSAHAALAKTEAQHERAEAQLTQKRATAVRYRELADRGVGKLEVAEVAETEAIAAQADVAVIRAETLVARASIAEAEASLQAEKTAWAKHTLIAPFDAVVIARLREPGTALNPGEPVFTLVSPDSMWALAYVDESRAGGIAIGQTARVTLRSHPSLVITAQVARIGLEADRVTEERRIFVQCGNCPTQPVIGEQAEIVIETGQLTRARLIPENAVHGYDGVSGTVWTVESGRLARRQVRFAARMIDARLAVTDGLAEQIPIVVRIDSGFAVGRAVQVTP